MWKCKEVSSVKTLGQRINFLLLDYVVDVPPTWMRVVDEVNYDVQKIRTKCMCVSSLLY